MEVEPKIHTLANGATVLVTITSPRESPNPPGHAFSDGTWCESQHKEICDRLKPKRTKTHIRTIKGMPCSRQETELSSAQFQYLRELCKLADIVIVRRDVLESLQKQGRRHYVFNAMSANCITSPIPPDRPVIDIDNWTY